MVDVKIGARTVVDLQFAHMVDKNIIARTVVDRAYVSMVNGNICVGSVGKVSREYNRDDTM